MDFFWLIIILAKLSQNLHFYSSLYPHRDNNKFASVHHSKTLTRERLSVKTKTASQTKDTGAKGLGWDHEAVGCVYI